MRFVYWWSWLFLGCKETCPLCNYQHLRGWRWRLYMGLTVICLSHCVCRLTLLSSVNTSPTWQVLNLGITWGDFWIYWKSASSHHLQCFTRSSVSRQQWFINYYFYHSFLVFKILRFMAKIVIWRRPLLIDGQLTHFSCALFWFQINHIYKAPSECTRSSTAP